MTIESTKRQSYIYLKLYTYYPTEREVDHGRSKSSPSPKLYSVYVPNINEDAEYRVRVEIDRIQNRVSRKTG